MLPEIKLYVNRSLFSDHFLHKLLPKDESWAVDEDKVRLAMQATLNLYAPRKEELPHLNEAQLEQEFVRPLLESLGHVFQVQPSLPTSEGVRRPDYAFFATREDKRQAGKHKGKLDYFKKAIAIGDAKPWGRPLDKRQRRGTDKFDMLSPSWQIDYYLRTSEVPWAILTDGRFWRLYNRETSFRLDVYYQIDLPQILAARDIEAFKYFYLFFRRQAFIRDPEGLCFLDRVYLGSLEYAREVGGDLKENVYEALRILAEGFVETPGNNLDPSRDLQAIHGNALIYLYRLLFINYAEDRRLLPRDTPLYKETYGLVSMEGEIASKLERLESLSSLQATYWEKLRVLFDLINRGSEPFGIDKDTLFVPPYNGGLFDPEHHPFLEENRVADRWLAQVMDLLARSKGEGVGRAFVDYSSLDIRHLGSIYEGLLEYKLRVADEEMVVIRRRGREEWVSASKAEAKKALERVRPGRLYLATDRGERKATGSFYTPDYVVKYIVENTLGPLIEEKMKEEEPIQGILSLKVLDPAMGSGHFLVEATDRLAHALVQALGASEEEPREDDIRWARREVVERCVYGVDLNPLAVELAKLSLWLHTVAEGKPLNFLDHHLKVGNSLIGARVDDLTRPPVRKKRARAREGETTARQMSLFEQRLNEMLPTVLGKVLEITKQPSDALEDIRAKEAADQAIAELKAPFKAVADLWASTYFGNELKPAEYDEALEHIGERKKLLALPVVNRAHQIAEEKRFFHWELEFPEAFYEDSKRRDNSGFDAVVGNPPYDVLKRVKGEDERNKAIDFYRNYPAYKPAMGIVLNVFRLFLVRGLQLGARNCALGQIVPLTFMSDVSASKLRALLVDKIQLGLLECFPQKDDPKNRVFEDAKLSTMILHGRKGLATTSIRCRVHPGKLILQDSPLMKLPISSIRRFDPENLTIPVGTPDDVEVLERIYLSRLCIPMSQVAQVAVGEIDMTLDADCRTDDPGGSTAPLLKGAQIQRYQLRERPKQGKLEWVDLDVYREKYQASVKLHVGQHARVVFQGVTGTDDARRLTACLAPAGFFLANSVNYIAPIESHLDPLFLLALFNSQLLEWRFRLTSTNNNINNYEVDGLPFRVLESTTPPKHRRQLAEKGRKLYEGYFSEGHVPVLEFVDHHLEAGEAEVIHDLLAFLAKRLLDLNQQKCAEAKGFLDWLQGYTGVSIEEWRLKTHVKAYWEHPWDELQRALRQNRKAVEKASGRNVEGREALEAIQREFEQSVAQLKPLLQRIVSTDRLIDLIVYRLYGLTEEEVAIVEGE